MSSNNNNINKDCTGGDVLTVGRRVGALGTFLLVR